MGRTKTKKISAAEKQRLYRERRNADQHRRSEYLRKERESWQKKKQTKAWRPMAELSDREQRMRRLKNRKAQAKFQKKRKDLAACLDVTPPSTPVQSLQNQLPCHHVSSRQQTVGRKAVSAKRSKCYRDLEKCQQVLATEKKRTEMYRKRCQRILKRLKSPEELESPRTKTKKLLRCMSVPQKVRKTLLFHNTLIARLRMKYSKCKKLNKKRMIGNLIMCKLIRKYKLQSYCRSIMGFSNKVTTQKDISLRNKRLNKSTSIASNVKKFYVRDDVSRNTAGKKETITNGKIKKQRRYLVDTMNTLHSKFLSENPSIQISYSLFCKLRPFWVLIPQAKNRDTCLCKLHENLQFIALKLRKLGCLSTPNLDTLADMCACDSLSRDCMYSKCSKCASVNIVNEVALDKENHETVSYYQWVSSTEVRHNKTGDEISVKVVKKEQIYSSRVVLCEKFNKMMIQFKKHIFNIRHQYHQSRLLKQNLVDNECIIHIDFAENYVCKYATEIQSVHFGASHQQATLHNGLYYIKDGNDLSVNSFCTISDSKQHDPISIWQYLDPILTEIKNEHPVIEVLHFFSDGPCTQYRQKTNFYLLCNKLFDKGFKAASWNFTEAGHGKGAADGIGATVKRSADRSVSLQNDLSTPKLMYDALNNKATTVRLYDVENEIVQEASQQFVKDLPTLPGTMNIHQVICVENNIINFRDISCFCSQDKLSCKCYDIKKFSYGNSSALPFPIEKETEQANGYWNPFLSVSADMIGQHCLIKYDNKPYPGKIIDVDIDASEFFVSCMCKIGDNRFFWPNFKDTTWYEMDDMLTVIPEPELIGRSGRHYQVQSRAWNHALNSLDN